MDYEGALPPPLHKHKDKKMSIYQVQARVNGLTVNTDIEASGTDKVLSFYESLSNSEVLQVKKYVYLNPEDLVHRNTKQGRYAITTVYFRNALPLKLKIPDLKPSVDDRKIISFLHNIYTNVDKVSVSIKGYV